MTTTKTRFLLWKSALVLNMLSIVLFVFYCFAFKPVPANALYHPQLLSPYNILLGSVLLSFVLVTTVPFISVRALYIGTDIAVFMGLAVYLFTLVFRATLVFIPINPIGTQKIIGAANYFGYSYTGDNLIVNSLYLSAALVSLLLVWKWRMVKKAGKSIPFLLLLKGMFQAAIVFVLFLFFLQAKTSQASFSLRYIATLSLLVVVFIVDTMILKIAHNHA